MNGTSAAAPESAPMLERTGTVEPAGPVLRGSVPCGADGGLLFGQAGQPGRLNLTQDDAKNGLGRLVLTVVKLLHELLERQAIRRIEAGALTEVEIERLGTTLMRQAEEIDRLRQVFKLEDEDLNIDLGPLGRLL